MTADLETLTHDVTMLSVFRDTLMRREKEAFEAAIVFVSDASNAREMIRRSCDVQRLPWIAGLSYNVPTNVAVLTARLLNDQHVPHDAARLAEVLHRDDMDTPLVMITFADSATARAATIAFLADTMQPGEELDIMFEDKDGCIQLSLDNDGAMVLHPYDDDTDELHVNVCLSLDDAAANDMDD